MRLIAALCGLAALGPALASHQPFSFDTAAGRLPKSVVPETYAIEITPDVQAKKIAGRESVVLRFRSATDKLVFNSLGETLSDVRLDGQPVKSVVSSDAQQLSTVTLAKPAAVGTHTLTLSYVGTIETRPQGLFVQPYDQVGGGQAVMLSTQMEGTDARRMFPCWDEPAFRAAFQLTVTVPAAWAVISNMPVAKRVEHGALATTTFERSPSMPSYLVELTAGDLKALTATGAGVTYGVWAVRGRELEGATALANARLILPDYNDYFGYPYPLPKLDSIAIPGGFSGAMENWGAITYNDRLLLVSASSSIADRQEVFSTQAHEMAHQWNGDLVTVGWWDVLWLNESFASWMAAKETDRRNPSWKWWESEDASKERAMLADAAPTTHAIQVPVTDELQAAAAFDPVVTYNKGQAVLRMLEAYLGPDTFRDGVRRYIKARAFGNATSADLWNGLNAASGQDVAAIASNWTEQPGFPLVSVTSRCDAQGNRTIALSQQRFFRRQSDTAGAQTLRWRVPLQIRAGTNPAPQAVLLVRDAQTVPAGRCDEPLSVDANAIGYYRVGYDAATLAVNTRSFDRIPDADRIAMLDDQWALIESGAAPLPTYLALAERMGGSLDTRAWTQIADSLGIIEYAERGTAGHDAFAAYARSIVHPLGERLGWDAKPDETPGIQQLRRTVIRNLGTWGDQAVIAEARRRFALFLKDRKAIPVDEQGMVLTIVGRYADAATFDQLRNLAKQTRDDSERTRYCIALASARDPQLAAQAAAFALSKDIPPQSVMLRAQMLFTLRDEQPRLAWSTFSSNEKTLLAQFGNLEPLILAQYVPQYFWNSVPLNEMRTWVLAHVPAEMAGGVEKGIEGAKFKVEEKSALVPAADAYLKAKAARTTASKEPR